MDKPKLHTPDFAQENIAKLAALFPNCVTESRDDQGVLRRAIDFDQLKQELSTFIVDGPRERFCLNWPGKREALLAANAPIAKTLRPSREESVDFDKTKNLFIEGDNLDALKLLQETFLNKIKLIYIDPPYNTGKDFIYKDDFKEGAAEYLIRSYQADEKGNRMFANTESNGRFHSDWLTMMYPRLLLARNLLSSDGAIFISIDDHEVENIKKLCNDVFGENNFLSQIIWQKIHSTKNDAKYFSDTHEYILVYARNIEAVHVKLLPRTAEMDARFLNPDNDPRGPWSSGDLVANEERKEGRFEIKGPTGEIYNVPQGKHWVYSKENLLKYIEEGRIWFGKNRDAFPRLKRYLNEVQQGRKCDTIWLSDEVGHNQESMREVKALFEGVGPFQNPKPVRLLMRCIELITEKDDIILDFFAGSGTTGHAVMARNAVDGGNRRYILIQLPEALDSENEDQKAAVALFDKLGKSRSIAELTKERLRRAGRKVKEANPLFTGDAGFRVLRVDTSNMKEVYYAPDAVKQGDLLTQADNIREDRTPEDLLFQVLVDWGVDLSLPITKETIAGKTVFFVDGNALVACFESKISEDLVKALAARKPLRAVFRDSGYGSDSVKINVEQIFKLLSKDTEIKTL